MANAIDLTVGKRIRRRRRLLGITQQQLAEVLGIRAQQLQKYESAANRVVAARLYALAVALNVPVNYFFEGVQSPSTEPGILEVTATEELQLIRAYSKLSERARRRLLDMAIALQDETAG